MDWLDNSVQTASRLHTYLPWFGYLFVSGVGGIAAYLKEWETKDLDPNLTVKQRSGMLGRRLFLAVFAGIIWYQIVIWQSMTGSPFSYIGASLSGLYATEFLDFLWTQFKSRVGLVKKDSQNGKG